MNKNAKIFIAGHKGMVGSALVRYLQAQGYTQILTATRSEVNLCHQDQTEFFFEKYKPEYVFLSAAKVGGIWANSEYPADFIYQNLCIQNNVLYNSYKYGVARLVFLGSSCIYPKQAPQPIKEEYLLSGYLESTNSAYALAKIAGVEMCRSFNKQFGTKYIAIMPCNLYGINDNYDLQNSHVLPALIKKIHEAKQENRTQVEIWGSGKPLREFLFVDDLAQGLVFIMNQDWKAIQQVLKDNYYPLINMGSGVDVSIKDLANHIAHVIDYKGDFYFNTEKPDGTMRKRMDVDNINKMGWQAQTSLQEGIEITYKDFLHKKNGY